MLRICNEKDCHDIWVINREEMGYDVDFEIAKEHIINVLKDDSQRIFVYEVDGRVVGYIHAATYNLLYSDPMKTILGLAVLKEFRRNGIGGCLLLMVEDWASDCGSEAVQLSTGKDRDVAPIFYQAWGYDLRKEQYSFIKHFTDNYNA